MLFLRVAVVDSDDRPTLSRSFSVSGCRRLPIILRVFVLIFGFDDAAVVADKTTAFSGMNAGSVELNLRWQKKICHATI